MLLVHVVLTLALICANSAQNTSFIVTVLNISPTLFNESVQDNIKMGVANNVNEYCKLTMCFSLNNRTATLYADNVTISNVTWDGIGITFYLNLTTYIDLQLKNMFNMLQVFVQNALQQHGLKASLQNNTLAPIGVTVSPRSTTQAQNTIVNPTQETTSQSSQESTVQPSLTTSASSLPTTKLLTANTPQQNPTTQYLPLTANTLMTTVVPLQVIAGLARMAFILTVVICISCFAIILLITLLVTCIFWWSCKKRKSKKFPLSNETPLEPLNENVYTSVQSRPPSNKTPEQFQNDKLNTPTPRSYETPGQFVKPSVQDYEVPLSSHQVADVPETKAQASMTTSSFYQTPVSSKSSPDHLSVAQPYEVPVQPYLTPVQSNSYQTTQ